MTTPVLHRVDLDAEYVDAHDGAARDPRRYDGTDAPPEGALSSPPGNGDLDRPELEKGEQRLAQVLGW